LQDSAAQAVHYPYRPFVDAQLPAGMLVQRCGVQDNYFSPGFVTENAMLLSTQANRYAHQLLAARLNAQQIPPFSAENTMSVDDAYNIAHRLLQIRTAQGETAVGRKIGFGRRQFWAQASEADGSDTPYWAHIYDDTVRHTEENRGVQSLQGAVSPRLEPSIVFKLGARPGPDATLEEIAECIEWMAHGIEIADCLFPNWNFQEVDAIAAFGLHGTLIVGEAKILSTATRSNLASVLAQSMVSVSCNESGEFTLRGAGLGSDVMGSPVHALLRLHQLLQTQPQFQPLQAGEIIATGAWTTAFPVKPGQTWTTAFSGISLPGLTLSFV
jgi:2-keto-4-pentenoate hydratase